jgi:hypothetical protein
LKKPSVPGENQIDTGPPKEGNGGREKRKASDKADESQDTDTRKRAKNTEERIDLSEEGKNLVAHRIACLINFTKMRAKDEVVTKKSCWSSNHSHQGNRKNILHQHAIFRAQSTFHGALTSFAQIRETVCASSLKINISVNISQTKIDICKDLIQLS